MDELRFYNACDLLTGNKDSLGKGNFAFVRICKIRESEQFVAVKCFAITGDHKKVSNAEKEAKILAKINHVNILSFMGVTKWQNYFGIVTELLPCGSLEYLLLSAREETGDELIPISMNLRCRFFLELAEAIQYLHCHNPTRSYIHGDIKPQNILLSNKLTIKLADFGSVFIAIAAGADPTTITGHKNTQHTPLYTAPEFLQNPFMDKTTAMDVYGYGMTGYEILTRKQVYSGNALGFARVVDKIEKEGIQPNPKYLREAADKCSTKDLEVFCELKQVVLQCYVTNRNGRPAISNIWKILSGLAKSHGIYNEEITKEAINLAIKFSTTVNQEVKRTPLDHWSNSCPPNVETSSSDNPVSMNLTQPIISDEQRNAESELLSPLIVEAETDVEITNKAITERTLSYQNHDIPNGGVTQNKLSSHCLQCFFKTPFLKKIKDNKRHFCVTMTLLILVPFCIGIFVFLRRQISVKYSPNFTKYTVEQGGMLQILCKADTWFLSPPVEWRETNYSKYVEIPMMMDKSATLNLTEYQILYPSDNKALLVLTNVQQSNSYSCFTEFGAVTHISVEVRIPPENTSQDGNLTCLQGREVLGISNLPSNTLTYSQCNAVSDRGNYVSYMCSRLHFCYKNDNTYSHVVEASCVPADQCSSLMCRDTDFPGVTQDSCQATCCSTTNCSNYFVDIDDYSSCEPINNPLDIFLFALWLASCSITVFPSYLMIMCIRYTCARYRRSQS